MAAPLDFKPLTDLGRQAMALSEDARQTRMAEQTLKLQAQQEQIGALQIQEAMKEAQRKKEIVPVNSHPMFIQLPVEAQNKLTESMVSGKYGTYDNGVLSASRENLERFMKDMSTNTDMLQKNLLQPMQNAALAENQKAMDAYMKGQEKFKAGQITQQELDGLKSSYQATYAKLQDTVNKGSQAVGKAQIGKRMLDLQQSGEWDKLPAEMQRGYATAFEMGDPQMIEKLDQQFMTLKTKAAEKNELTEYQKRDLAIKEAKLARGDGIDKILLRDKLKEEAETRKETRDNKIKANSEVERLKKEYSRRQTSSNPMTLEEWNESMIDIKTRYPGVFDTSGTKNIAPIVSWLAKNKTLPQEALYKQLKDQNWTDEEIGAAWKQANGK